MAENTTGYLIMPNGERYDFTLNGLAQFKQLEQLIKLTAELIKLKDPNNQAAKDAAKNVTSLSSASKQSAANIRTLGTSATDASDSFKNAVEELEQTFRPLLRGDWRTALDKVPGVTTKLAVGVGLLTGSLVGYADQLSAGLQRGISGGIFDFAIAAKSAGISMSAFNKALEESGGGFASLDIGATAGAKQFGVLIDSVRNATAGVGNLGLNNEQMAEFTARQLKVAISQGFKGKQAQDQVIKNSRELAEELDILANKTGKSVLELAQAAAKLAMDPIVANFIKNAQQGGDRISSASQRFAAGLRGMFGELGDTLAGDALRSAMSGLPLVITQTGKNMILASQGFYTELERLAIRAKEGVYSEEDQQRIYDLIQKEVKARGQELRYLAQLEGPIGQSAKQFLELAKEAEFYNSAAGKERRERDKTAQLFNAEVRKFQANLQKLAIPFLQLINEINWAGFFSVFNTGISVIIDFTKLVSEFVSRFKEKINSIINLVPGLGDIEDPLGKSVGYIIGLGSAIVVAMGALTLLKTTFGTITKYGTTLVTSFASLKTTIGSLTDFIKTKIRGTTGRGTIISGGPNPLDIPAYRRRQRPDLAVEQPAGAATPTAAARRMFSASIDAGYGTSAFKPLYVSVVRGVRGAAGDGTYKTSPGGILIPEQREPGRTQPRPGPVSVPPRDRRPSREAEEWLRSRNAPTQVPPTPGRFGGLKGMLGTGALVVGGSVAADMISSIGSDTKPTGKELGGTAGSLLGSIAGAGGAALLGRVIGGGLGTVLGGPAGTLIGATMGGVVGQKLGEAIPEWFSKDDIDTSDSLKRERMDAETRNVSLYQENLNVQKQILAKLTEQENISRYGVNIASRQASTSESSLRYLRDQSYLSQVG